MMQETLKIQDFLYFIDALVEHTCTYVVIETAVL